MAKLIFPAADVARVCRHSIENRQGEIARWETANEGNGWKPETYTPDVAHVIFVHDDGVYLMSNGQPRDIIAPDVNDQREENKDHGRSFAAYAKGCDPVKDAETCWDTSRALVGGDDFGEWLPWAKELLAMAEEPGAEAIALWVGEKRIEILGAIKPNKAPKKKAARVKS